MMQVYNYDIIEAKSPTELIKKVGAKMYDTSGKIATGWVPQGNPLTGLLSDGSGIGIMQAMVKI